MSNKPVKNTRLSPATEEDKINYLKNEKGISLDENLKDTRGIYGFFAKKGSEEKLFYIGKANNIYYRMIASKKHGYGSGHLSDYYSICNGGNVKRTDVHDLLDKYHNAGYDIEARLIKEVPYDKNKSTQYNANMLVFEELKALLDCQEKGECADQYHEGVKLAEKNTWKKSIRKQR